MGHPRGASDRERTVSPLLPFTFKQVVAKLNGQALGIKFSGRCGSHIPNLAEPDQPHVCLMVHRHRDEWHLCACGHRWTGGEPARRITLNLTTDP
ncbi:MAG TPA: hypothetical protein VFH51_14745 [Myxococcota bacterium]|nr:hypothetical protein [Myxococcota bacterium]